MPSQRDDGPKIAASVAQQFDSLEVQLKSFYDEISTISAKKPDSPINKFKLKFLNQTLENINKVLGDSFLPFPDFRTFNEDDLPTASDVVVMLDQYLKCTTRFFRDHTYFKDSVAFWRTGDFKELRAYRSR